ncbi:C39 family peptidase [Patescibacteria group bacterium]|nr:C39 family peptidase [Patescibacteria group bacterium]
MKKYFLIILVALALIAFGIWYYWDKSKENIDLDLPPAQTYKDFKNLAEQNPTNNESVDNFQPEELIVNNNTNEVVEQPEKPDLTDNQNQNPLPVTSINLNVPFTSQAPTANWEQPFQDACEEAAILMADYYVQGKSMPSVTEVENILKDMIDWQSQNMDGEIDMDISELAYFAKNYLGYEKYEIVEDLSVEKIISYLNRGLPLVVPANGKLLDNPNFSNGGPVYHMLVIKGYKDGHFITNDPGTRLGHNFIYTFENMLYSIADWDAKTGQATGPKRALVIY